MRIGPAMMAGYIVARTMAAGGDGPGDNPQAPYPSRVILGFTVHRTSATIRIEQVMWPRQIRRWRYDAHHPGRRPERSRQLLARRHSPGQERRLFLDGGSGAGCLPGPGRLHE